MVIGEIYEGLDQMDGWMFGAFWLAKGVTCSSIGNGECRGTFLSGGVVEETEFRM